MVAALPFTIAAKPLSRERRERVNLWMQWDGMADGQSDEWLLEVELCKDNAGEFQWKSADGGPLTETWMVLPTFRERWGAKARARAAREDAPLVEAQEVTFTQSRCPLEGAGDRRTVHSSEEMQFAAVGHGASCIHTLSVELEAQPGAVCKGEMTSALATDYCQLDDENYFLIRSLLGLTIRNLALRVDEVTPTGRGDTQTIRSEEREGDHEEWLSCGWMTAPRPATWLAERDWSEDSGWVETKH